MYNNNDIERFLIEARKNKEKVLAAIKKNANGMDYYALCEVVNESDFVAEDFCRYDSDVCEQFLTIMEIVGIAGNEQTIQPNPCDNSIVLKISGSMGSECGYLKVNDITMRELIYMIESYIVMVDDGIESSLEEHLEKMLADIEPIIPDDEESIIYDIEYDYDTNRYYQTKEQET